jgi:anti-anti-sigma factor
MTIAKNQTGNKLIIALEGRLDTTTAPELQEQLILEANEGKDIQLDFGQLAYVSSAGLRVLLLGEKTARAKGGKITLVNVSAEIRDVFDMTGFSGILTLE